MKKRTVLHLLTILFLCSGNAQGDTFYDRNFGDGAAEYLSIPLNAQCKALGGAGGALTSNLCGLQFNPSIVDATELQKLTLYGTYSLLSLDRTHFGATISGNLGNFLAAGVSMTGYGIGQIQGRNEAGEKTELFDYRENALGVSIAGRLHIPVSIGGRVQYLYESLENEQANGFTFDAGITYRPFPFFHIGLSFSNVLGRLYWTTGHVDTIQAEVRFSLAGTLLDSTLIIAADARKKIDQHTDFFGGIQYLLIDIIYLRLGLATSLDIQDMDSRVPDFATGIGLKLKDIGFDYALTIPSSDLGLTHTITISGRLTPFWEKKD